MLCNKCGKEMPEGAPSCPFWWLRSPGHGYNGNFVACSLYGDGSAGWDIGNYVFDDTKFTLLGVRPALYLEK